MESHLLQMRGLKLNHFRILVDRNRVASFTDAWIETPCRLQSLPLPDPSHLLQMRGLKLLQASVKFNTHSRIFYRCVD